MTLVSANDIIGSLAYLLGFAAAIAAAVRLKGAPGTSARIPEWIGWALIAGLFLMLAAWRIWNGDEWLRQSFGEAKVGGYAYAHRRRLQGPLALMLATAGIVALYYANRYVREWSLPGRLAAICAAALLGFSLIRAISFHPVDRLIYFRVGPVNLNRLIDTGLTFLIFLLSLSPIQALLSSHLLEKPRRRRQRRRR